MTARARPCTAHTARSRCGTYGSSSAGTCRARADPPGGPRRLQRTHPRSRRVRRRRQPGRPLRRNIAHPGPVHAADAVTVTVDTPKKAGSEAHTAVGVCAARTVAITAPPSAACEGRARARRRRPPTNTVGLRRRDDQMQVRLLRAANPSAPASGHRARRAHGPPCETQRGRGCVRRKRRSRLLHAGVLKDRVGARPEVQHPSDLCGQGVVPPRRQLDACRPSPVSDRRRA